MSRSHENGKWNEALVERGEMRKINLFGSFKRRLILLKHMTFHGLEIRCSVVWCIAYFTTHLDTSAERSKTTTTTTKNTNKQTSSKMCYLPVLLYIITDLYWFTLIRLISHMMIFLFMIFEHWNIIFFACFLLLRSLIRLFNHFYSQIHAGGLISLCILLAMFSYVIFSACIRKLFGFSNIIEIQSL